MYTGIGPNSSNCPAPAHLWVHVSGDVQVGGGEGGYGGTRVGMGRCTSPSTLNVINDVTTYVVI